MVGLVLALSWIGALGASPPATFAQPAGPVQAHSTVTAAACVAPRPRLYATAANLGIVEIDPIKGTILRTFQAPSQQGVADGLAYDGSRLYYINGSRESDRLYELDPDVGTVLDITALPESSFRNGLAALQGSIYILDWSAITQDISVWDTSRGRIARTLDIDGANPGVPLISGGLAAISGPDALLVTTAQTNEVLEVNATTGRITHRFAHGMPGVLGIAVIDNEIYLGSNTSSSLAVFSRGGLRQRTVPVADAIGFQSLAGDVIGAMTCTIHLPFQIRFGR
jgi:DNA-binding beta-propeller fold protein YncE